MKLNIPKSWFESRIDKEEAEIGAGNPNLFKEMSDQNSEQALADEIKATVAKLSELVYKATDLGLTVHIQERGEFVPFNCLTICRYSQNKGRKLTASLNKTVEY